MVYYHYLRKRYITTIRVSWIGNDMKDYYKYTHLYKERQIDS